jgi:hypothetical protein
MSSPVIIAMYHRVLENAPFTYGDLAKIAEEAGGKDRDADRYIQQLRRKGIIEFARVGREVLWSKRTPAPEQDA